MFFVFDAGPEVHRDRAKLHFHIHILLLAREKDRNPQDQMKAAIPVLLGRSNVVLLLQDLHVVLHVEGIPDAVNIVYERADHADARHVIDRILDVLDRKGNALHLEFSINAAGRLEPALNIFKRISAILQRHFLIEDLQLGPHLGHRAVKIHHHDLKLLRLFRDREKPANIFIRYRIITVMTDVILFITCQPLFLLHSGLRILVRMHR